MFLQPEAKLQAPLAQSVERFHGKEEVFGSTPEGGSACLALPNTLQIGFADLRRDGKPRAGEAGTLENGCAILRPARVADGQVALHERRRIATGER